MKKILILLLFTIFITKGFAQKDTEHWFAPYYDNSNGTSATGYSHAIYFSTDALTPFDVNIYNNNAIIGTVSISKNNPQTFVISNAQIRGYNTTDASAVKTQGIYTTGEKPYYASLRIGKVDQSEVVTSKGKNALGTLFYNGATPITVTLSIANNSNNFTTGFLATEDNITVTVSGYYPMVQFLNITTVPTPASITFNLNKGQSYILAGRASVVANKEGFIGAKIVSNKPIAVTNGNSNGNFATTGASGNDLILDQSVPVDMLGTKFAMSKSMSTST